MRYLRRSLVGLFLLALTVGLFAAAGGSIYSSLKARWTRANHSRPARERVLAANVVRVTPRDIAPVLIAFGEVKSRRTLDLRARTAGRIISLAPGFEDGGAVTRGQVLAQIDPVDAQAALATAQTDLDEAGSEQRDAERALALARDELKAAEEQASLRSSALARQRNLSRRGIGTAAAVETAQLALSVARQASLARRQNLARAQARIDKAGTALERRRISLAAARRRLAQTTIRAEFSGVLADVAVVQGGLLAVSERLARLIDSQALEVAFRVSTAQYAQLLDGDRHLLPAPVTATLDVPGVDLSASGRITRESGSVAKGETGRLLFARLQEAPGLRPGDFVAVRVREPVLKGVAVLPAAAVDAAGTVLAVGPQARLRVAPVVVLRKQGDTVIVRAPALAGLEVVAARTPLLGAGIRVRPVSTDAPVALAGPEMVVLTPERRARLIAFVQASRTMPAKLKARVLVQLGAKAVPAQMVARIERRMGG